MRFAVTLERGCERPFPIVWLGDEFARHFHQLGLQFLMRPARRQNVEPQPAGPGFVFGLFFDPRQILANLLPVLLRRGTHQEPQINLGRNLSQSHQGLLGDSQRGKRQMEGE